MSFQVGDVISIDNADRPAWVEGQWLVAACAETARGWRVRLLPLRHDGVLDGARDHAFTYSIEDGGFVRRPRVKGAIISSRN